MPEDPLKAFENLDPKLLSLVRETERLALTDGALPRKFKLLIALALDAAHGAEEGVKALAQIATKAGVTKEEIAETMRVAQYVSVVGSVYTASRALRGLF
jgi:AhpD family alkylhydroperoxidase